MKGTLKYAGSRWYIEHQVPKRGEDDRIEPWSYEQLPLHPDYKKYLERPSFQPKEDVEVEFEIVEMIDTTDYEIILPINRYVKVAKLILPKQEESWNSALKEFKELVEWLEENFNPPIKKK
jgi:hypothetical protein